MENEMYSAVFALPRDLLDAGCSSFQTTKFLDHRHWVSLPERACKTGISACQQQLWPLHCKHSAEPCWVLQIRKLVSSINPGCHCELSGLGPIHKEHSIWKALRGDDKISDLIKEVQKENAPVALTSAQSVSHGRSWAGSTNPSSDAALPVAAPR